MGVRPRALLPPLLAALAASRAAVTLASLALTGSAADVERSAEWLGRLPRLRCVYVVLVDDAGVAVPRAAADGGVAVARMVSWMRERLPRVAVVPGAPKHWAG